MILSLITVAALSNFPNAKVVSVYDADTFRVFLENEPAIFRQMSVRVRGIDAPEIRAKRACEKRDALRAKELFKRALGESVDLRNCGADKYYRLLCTVDEADILLKEGYAQPYDGGKKKVWRCKDE